MSCLPLNLLPLEVEGRAMLAGLSTARSSSSRDHNSGDRSCGRGSSIDVSSGVGDRDARHDDPLPAGRSPARGA